LIFLNLFFGLKECTHFILDISAKAKTLLDSKIALLLFGGKFILFTVQVD